MARSHVLAGVVAVAAYAAPVAGTWVGGQEVLADKVAWRLNGLGHFGGRALTHINDSDSDPFELPEFYQTTTYGCIMAFSEIMSSTYSDPDTDILAIYDECGITYTTGILMSKPQDDLCDPDGSVEDYGDECEDFLAAFEALACISLWSASSYLVPYFEAFEGLRDGECTDDEIAGIQAFYVDSFTEGANPFNALLKDCHYGVHPCVAEGGPIDLDVLGEDYASSLVDLLQNATINAPNNAPTLSPSDSDGILFDDSDPAAVVSSMTALGLGLSAAALVS